MFKGKKEEAPSTGEAIQKLREMENMLNKKQEFLESKIEEELNIARTNASKNKRGMCYQQVCGVIPVFECDLRKRKRWFIFALFLFQFIV